MPNLLIKYSYGNWYAFLSNSTKTYRFAGANAEAQIVRVRQLQNAMTEGSEQVIGEMRNVFAEESVPEGEEAAVAEQLFGTTTELYFEGSLVYEATEGVELMTEIVEAGEALAAFV
ncbi:hypothetical protein [Marinoscillum sp. MHG1-6]|uniref:hypothetical protein n=1 Tax=Marinoscillum sp. MHG1-6 TaxID=2959627 RepID=UPI0021587131|nr:hypothetical protein [Marinoscillum sp. MHG1-6]